MAKKKKVLKVPDGMDKYGVISAEEVLEAQGGYLRLPSRLLWFNEALGGGFVYGRIHELYGFESTGKSLLAKDLCFAAQCCGGVVGWADAEQAFDANWAKQNDLDLDSLYVFDENSVDRIADWARDFALYWRSKLTNNEPIVIVVDSIAALDKIDFMGADMEGSSAKMGNRAKAIDEFYRTRNKIFAKTGVIVIMVNQVRNKLGASQFESNETTPGGNATKFYASIRVEIRRGKQIKGKLSGDKWTDAKTGKGVKKIGQIVYVSFPKNKTHAPHGSVATEVYFLPTKSGYVGFNRYSDINEILVEQGVIEQKGSRYYYKGNMIANGADAFIREFTENSKLRRKLLRKSDIPTISKFQKKLDSIENNRYPVEDALD